MLFGLMNEKFILEENSYVLQVFVNTRFKCQIQETLSWHKYFSLKNNC